MASNKLLVPLETIKSNSYIEPNVEPSKLRQAALEAQRVEVRGVLGATLTDLFFNAINDTGSPTGLTYLQETFYNDFLVPMMSSYCEAQFIYATHYAISNVGLMVNKNANNEAASDDAVNAAYRRAMSRGDNYAKRAKACILHPDSVNDLGTYYLTSDQNVTPQVKVTGGMIYTPYRRTTGDNCEA